MIHCKEASNITTLCSVNGHKFQLLMMCEMFQRQIRFLKKKDQKSQNCSPSTTHKSHIKFNNETRCYLIFLLQSDISGDNGLADLNWTGGMNG